MNKLYLAPTTLPDAAPLDYVAAAAQAGYDGLGLRLNRSPGLPFHPVVGDAALTREVKRALKDSGLPVHDILSFYLLPDTDVASFAPAMELGAEIGGQYAMTICDDPEWGRLRDNFAKLCVLAARCGLTPSLEFVPFRALASLPQAAKLIAETGDKAVICFDPLHFVRGGAQPADLAAYDPKLFPYAQISDGVLKPGEPDPAMLGKMDRGERRLPGKGTLPLRALLAALPAGIPLSVEAPNMLDEPFTDKQWAKRALDVTRAYLKAG